MEEKNVTKISLSTFFLILAIITIIIMAIYIYKLNNDKSIEIQKTSTLETQINNLEKKLSSISSILETTTNNNNTVNTSTNITNNTTSSNSNTNKDTIKNKIIGNWKADNIVDSNGIDLGLKTIYGSGIYTSNNMKFQENGILKYGIGITSSSDDGSYTINENIIKCGIPTDVKGEFNWKNFTYVPEEDILQEELTDFSGQKLVITFIRNN